MGKFDDMPIAFIYYAHFCFINSYGRTHYYRRYLPVFRRNKYFTISKSE